MGAHSGTHGRLGPNAKPAGELLWRRRAGITTNYLAHASSPNVSSTLVAGQATALGAVLAGFLGERCHVVADVADILADVADILLKRLLFSSCLSCWIFVRVDKTVNVRKRAAVVCAATRIPTIASLCNTAGSRARDTAR